MTDKTVLPATIYSIGHSNHPIERFIALLRDAGIEAVLDVRSVPQSRYVPQFGRQRLEAALAAAGLGYVFLGDALGGKPQDPALRPDGVADYELMAATPAFTAGLGRVAAEGDGRRVALMCAEKAPLDCHRTVLVSRHLAARGHAVMHILADGMQVAHTAIEAELLRRHAPADDLLMAADGRDVRLAFAYRRRWEQMMRRPKKESR
ncbi:DUF488 family protein [Reyranella sp. CPCC 100927]|uniref:DUF488 domain-containing protein n=1 Tax=Reyranella sp. CPCC 100927 TaxID=2599616 RepID=UPI0011B5C4ED|nr:DUF488 domain-containing protein [Reyranella sp. CPCC 100927]TWT05146.1 DUF488 domain-containing protein [Reyranella sp. CPCC 100927]